MPSKAPGSPQERRSGAGWYMGSLTPSQRLVGPVSQTQTNVWELDRGVLGVSGARGEGQRVPREPKANHMRGRITQAIPRALPCA